MKIRAAVLEHTGGTLAVQDVDLAPPRPGEVLVRLAASGVCHSDQNAIDGTAETPCPAVLGHEGAGVVEALGDGVTELALGDHVTLSWTPSCGRCDECIRDLPQHCRAAWPSMAAGALLDGTTRLSRDGERLHHYSLISSFAEACVVPERSCVVIPKDVPFDVAGLVGCAVTTGVGAVWNTARVRPGRPGRDRRLRRRRPLGASGCGRGRRVRDRRRRRLGVEARRRGRARGDAGRTVGRDAGRDRGGGSRSERGRRRLCDRGDREARRDARGLPLHPEPRRGRADRHPARGRAALGSRADDSPDGAAHPRLDLRVGAARARLPHDPRSVPARTPSHSTGSSRIVCRSSGSTRRSR